MADLALLTIFPALMAFAACSDLLTMTIPNRVSLALVAAFPIFALAAGLGPAEFGWHLAAGLLVLVIAFGFFSLGWIGGGDAKLAAATALWFGFAPLMDYLLVSAALGGLLTLAVLQLRARLLPRFVLAWRLTQQLRDHAKGIPYGIALAAAALVVYPHTPLFLALAGR